MTGFAFSRELGREEFEGTLDGRAIKFDTTYTFDAIWPTGSCPAPTPESEVAGGCTHYVSGEGVDGIIRFYDIIPTVGKGATNFLYEGVLTVSDQTSVAATPVVAPRVDVAAVELPSAPHAPRSCLTQNGRAATSAGVLRTSQHQTVRRCCPIDRLAGRGQSGPKERLRCPKPFGTGSPS
jgi:hypothetical protein